MSSRFAVGTWIGRYEVLECLVAPRGVPFYRCRAATTRHSVLLVPVTQPETSPSWPTPCETYRYGQLDFLVFEHPRTDSTTTSYNPPSLRLVPHGERPPHPISMVETELIDVPGSLRAPELPVDSSSELPFLGDRFVLRRKLGEGGFGEVYEAFDEQRQCTVAIKRLRQWDGDRLRRFKQEFRQISNLRHPNLIKCYELFLVQDEAYFSMERVEGFSLQAWLRTQMAPTGGPKRRIIDADGFRRVASDLAQALAFLHAHGKLHRDIKPSNVMIDAAGRTLLLDFGLVLDHETIDDSRILVGTPRYFAPEQILQGSLTSAVDLYQLGLLMFELLTGTSPWSGAPSESWFARLADDAPRLSSLARGVPADLEGLVASLLRRDPEQRPSAADVVAQLEQPQATPHSRQVACEHPLIGRAQEREQLREAVRRVNAGVTTLALIEGHSGMGKSALLEALRHELQGSGESFLVFSGRCFEWESVPFNAFDAINDAIVEALHRFAPSEAAALLGDDIEHVARLFPVFAELLSPTGAARFSQGVLSGQARRLALRGYRSLLGRLSQRHKVILVIDDIQWGDPDSAAVLLELLQPQDRPTIAVLLAARLTEDTQCPCVDVFHRLFERPSVGLETARILVGPLPDDDARELCRSVGGSIRDDIVGEIIRDTQGQPFFISEVVRRLGADVPRTSLDDLLRDRAKELTTCGLRLLTTLALIGHPVVRRVPEEACHASNYGSLTDAWTELSVGRWVKTDRHGDVDFVECYHDRIRESIAADVVQEERHCSHAAIARALERHQKSSTEAIAFHFLQAKLPLEAYPYTLEAALTARQSMAFEQAARLFGIAAELAPTPAQRWEHRLERAKALTSGGRGKEAAELYLELSTSGATTSRLELRRIAAEQLVSTGHVRQGIAVLDAVLDELGIKVPKTRLGVLGAHLLQSAVIRLRGVEVTRPPVEASVSDLAVIDCMRVLGALMSMVNPLMSAYFVRRHALLALRSGEPRRAAQALAEEATYISTRGGPFRKMREASLFADAHRRAARLGDDELRAGIQVLLGVSYICHSNWRAAYRVFEDCEELIINRHPGLTWELNQARLYRLYAMRCMGAWREVASAAKSLIDDAYNREDRYAEATYRTFLGDVPALLEDDPDAAIETMNIAMTRWEVLDYDIIRVTGHEGICNAVLYREHGEGPGALAQVLNFWRGMKRSGTWFVEANRIVWQDIRGRASLAASASARGSERRRLLRQAKTYAYALARSRVDWGLGCAERLLAGVAISEGKDIQAIARLQRAEAFFQRGGMELMQSAACWRRAQLLGGDEGARLVETQLTRAREQGAKNPESLLATMVPGRWRVSGGT